MCQTTGAEARLWGRANASVSVSGGAAGIREEHTGAIVLWTGFLEGKFERVMTVGAFGTHSAQPTVSTYVSTLCRACGGFFVGTGDEQDVGSPLKRSEASQKSRGQVHRQFTQRHSADCYWHSMMPWAGPAGEKRILVLGTVKFRPASVSQTRVWVMRFRRVKIELL